MLIWFNVRVVYVRWINRVAYRKLYIENILANTNGHQHRQEDIARVCCVQVDKDDRNILHMPL